MNPDRLLKHFDQISEAPDAVPRLRRFILDLAVRGRLVEQDPKDEPASELIQRIEALKKRLDVMRGIRPTLPQPAIEKSQYHFAIPASWNFVPIETIAFLEMGQSPKSEFYNQNGDGIPFFQGKADFGRLNPTPRYWCTAPT